MNSPLKFSNELLGELSKEKIKLQTWIASANPFAHPLEFSQEEVLMLKHSYNAIIKLQFLAGQISEIAYQQDLYVCPELS